MSVILLTPFMSSPKRSIGKRHRTRSDESDRSQPIQPSLRNTFISEFFKYLQALRFFIQHFPSRTIIIKISDETPPFVVTRLNHTCLQISSTVSKFHRLKARVELEEIFLLSFSVPFNPSVASFLPQDGTTS